MFRSLYENDGLTTGKTPDPRVQKDFWPDCLTYDCELPWADGDEPAR
jgi:hypothetical protein